MIISFKNVLTCVVCFSVQGLDNVGSNSCNPRPASDLNPPRTDTYRLSMANLEGKSTGFTKITENRDHLEKTGNYNNHLLTKDREN